MNVEHEEKKGNYAFTDFGRAAPTGREGATRITASTSLRFAISYFSMTEIASGFPE